MPRRFDFISPGVSVVEIDESQTSNAQPDEDGALLIGRAPMGPANVPVKVTNLEDFYKVFGNPVSGKGAESADVWRNGGQKHTTYAMYAAQAWLASETAPVKFVRLLGKDATSQGTDYIAAGWDIQHKVAPKKAASVATAYGFFIFPSASTASGGLHESDTITGSLAAVIYTSGSSIGLMGDVVHPSVTTTYNGTVGVNTAGIINTLVESDDTAGALKNTFSIAFSSSHGSITTKTFHMDPTKKDGYIRNVLNCNPQKLDSTNFGAAGTEKYWLGATYDRATDELTTLSASAGQQFGLLLPLYSGSTFQYGKNSMESKASKTGWFINRNPSPADYASFSKGNASKLFRLCSLHEGENFQNSYGVKISDLKLGSTNNPDSTFSVSIVDGFGVAVEAYSGLTLNESSPDFVGKRIGDQYQEWNSTLKKYELKGEYPNRSDFVRVEMATDWKAGIQDDKMLPFGFHLPKKPLDIYIASGSTSGGDFTLAGEVASQPNWDMGHTGSGNGDGILNILDCDYTTIKLYANFPEFKLTTAESNNGSSYTKDDVFGVRQASNNDNISKKQWIKSEDFKDLTRAIPFGLDAHGDTSSLYLMTGSVFTLDDIIQDTTDTDKFYYEDGSHVAKTAVTSINTIGGTENILTGGVKQFHAPFFGGFDGLDITKVEPFSIADGLSNSYSETTHYAAATVKRALNIVSDKDLIDFDIISMPGLLHTNLTKDLMNVAEERSDALAVVDIDSGYRKSYENSGTELLGDATLGGSGKVIDNAKSRDYNTSYAAAYYPPVRIKDTSDGNGNITVVPPSVAAIGAIASSEANSEGPWFAPAGFNRGGISVLGGSAGPRVVGTIEHLTKQNRDDLYEENINPIARFPAVGEIVIFGQKTLQQTNSALDRINVRRLMIYLKKRIGKIANTILFDQNVRATWLRFKAKAERVLSDVQARFGITEYKLVLDETTTTADLVDRNILYAKVFIKPARAIEFIAIDFVITKTGIEL